MHDFGKYGAKHRGHHSVMIARIVKGASLSIKLAIIVFLMGLGARYFFGWLFLGGYLSWYWLSNLLKFWLWFFLSFKVSLLVKFLMVISNCLILLASCELEPIFELVDGNAGKANTWLWTSSMEGGCGKANTLEWENW